MTERFDNLLNLIKEMWIGGCQTELFRIGYTGVKRICGGCSSTAWAGSAGPRNNMYMVFTKKYTGKGHILSLIVY